MSAQATSSSGTALFVRRPILAFVLNALIVLAGVAGLFGAEIRELPNVDRPVVTVTTRFDGASPETVDQELTGRIEGAVGRVSGVRSISSNSRFGRSRVTLEFNDSVDIDVAATDVRDAVARIVNQLPETADQPEIVKADANAQPVMRIAVTSAGRSPQELTTIVQDRIEDRLISIDGVADLQIYGDREPIFRVDIDQLKLASRGLTLGDMQRALSNLAFDTPAGDLAGDRQSINVRTTATVATTAAFEALEIKRDVKVGDVATVTLGPAPGETVLRANGQQGLGIGVIRQATSNTLEISAGVRAVVTELNQTLPEDVTIAVTSDDAIFIQGSIEEVLKTLGWAVAIVIAVIFLFLRDLRATLIPALTLPVALIGTLAAIYMVGFSVNILTLLALVLATGMVVDDAIVVLENIVRQRAAGMGPRAAAVNGTSQVFFAVVTTTATLAAVFVPLSFLPGQAGGLFREFGFTLAMAVLLSSVVALSLCPVLASRMLTKAPDQNARGPMIWLGNRLMRLYETSLRGALAMPFVIVLIAAIVAATAAMMAGSIRQELTPAEDRAVALLSVTAPQGVSLDYTRSKMREIEEIVAPMQEAGEITNVFSITGFGADNRGFMVFTLAKWEDRTRSQQDIVSEINGKLGGIIGVRAFAIQPNSLGIRGAGRGLAFAITGDSYDQLSKVAEDMVAQLSQNPDMGQVRLEYERTQPQLFVQIDRALAADLGIDITGLGQALQAMLDGRTVGSVFIDDKSFDVKMLSTSTPVNDPRDLENIFVQSGNDLMVPLASFVTLEERAVAPELDREGQNRSVELTAGLTPDLSLGDALAEVRAIGDEVLAENNRIVPLAEAATLDQTNSGIFLTFGFAILVVFLVLAAQFESFISAVVVMATVPLGLACAVFALLLTGQSLNVYSQIGLVMLIGIMAKNGILIVEFANQLRDKGDSVRDAILNASTIRLRPVMMTMTSTVVGGIPLILSAGAGAEAREALGWVIVGGLGMATLSTLYLTPVAYLLLARFATPKAHEEARLQSELEAAQGI
ncbi:efflux RND transporter permease subunit [Pseudosulfitobacter pseudonitzschiae]|uniref:efflux RND transporter permease subunit n=1 Tax=Pseudosulfitobacter pseudonitzschiae TaxID=1402135 RepID=UPI001AF498EA|nr:efflux RND transporter permease subunit [Pseudosulfitobacter pseudonitzschiae]MBM1813981.1 efflux RND transporter permease subunit [Pseudosulfitobacter pseudonitzschiae]MBM1830974.1 efflux RND transporter permease subunit [Pseudosulfitobacter pseudonitzschiae]MBM1835841.1 efflux RND transporter permease subunit [Pseudosulfitobacter pseudonitzschiae]MBM1840687.1 efflux RND transporter permease subunit [Pseudosulfitobacter pseudonitzschiae]MBM1845325.1 efflux RND transporter permease subunit 